MFRFIELSINNWSFWQAIRVPLGREVIIIIGPNGSGKTTLLDALRQLLNAPRLSSKRRLQHYLERPDAPALIRAVVSNSSTPGKGPPFRQERITTPEATLACLLTPGPGGSPEKRFAILPGRPSLEKIRHVLQDTKEWYTPERYARALESAGVSRSLMAVLAVEQGSINQIFDWKSREIFTKVTEMLGSKAVLDRYREAKRRYNESEGELARQTQTLLLHQADLTNALREVERLETWERSRDKVAWLEKALPAAHLQAIIKGRQEASAKIPELRTKVRKGDTDKIRLEDELKKLAEKEEAAMKVVETSTGREEIAIKLWGENQARAALASEKVRQLEEKEQKLKSLPIGDLKKLTLEERNAHRTIAEAEHLLNGATGNQSSLTEKVRRLKAGIPNYPESVVATIASLKAADIRHSVIASTVEKVSEKLSKATEAALGDARFGIIVQPKDEKQVIQLAKKYDFPGPIYSGNTIKEPEKAGSLELAEGAPEWLRQWIIRTNLEKDGSWSDERGIWVAPPSDGMFLGTDALKVELDRIEAELKRASEAVTTAEGSLHDSEKFAEKAIAALEQEQERQRLLIDIKELPAARQAASEIGAEMKQAEDAHKKAKAAREAAQNTLNTVVHARNSADIHYRQFVEKLNGEKQALSEATEKTAQCETQIADLASQVSPEFREKAKHGDLDSEDTVQFDLGRARTDLEKLGASPAPEVRAEAKQLEANVQQLQEHVKARSQEAEAARQELSECRSRYLAVVSAALQDYRRRVLDLAKVANVTVEIDLPHLEDNDQVIDEAGIEARFGFDEKDPLPLGHPSFSGGQQVIAGLILLLAMAETEGQGFFILDEPFAHLSLDRVDQVGRFLRDTNSQFIITAPTTLDRAQLDPASQVIILSKRRPGELYAPLPVVAEE